ncbi:MAG TPA: prolipoprotein diacylglyceryl transferase family protein [Candidatus Limnocylindrales bacterium]
MPATVQFNFDPSLAVLGLSLRLETLGLAGAVFVVLLLAALGSGRSRGADASERLRRDDLILIAFGAVPGAVLGGRLGYGLLHLDFYASDPLALADPGQGGFELAMAVVLGTITAIAVARLLAAPFERWLGVAALPVLIGLGLGKLAMALGGAGQGSYSDLNWAVAYVGPGTWGSLNTSYSAIPSQLIEGAAVLGAAVLLFITPTILRLRFPDWWWIVKVELAPRRDWPALTGKGRFLTAMTLWALVRLAVAFTWRDGRVLGPVIAEQLLIVGLALAVVFGPALGRTLRRGPGAIRSRRAARRTARAEKVAKAEADAEARAAAAAAAALESADTQMGSEPADAGSEASPDPAEAAEVVEVAEVVEAATADPAAPGPDGAIAR